jgi:hypothetical protein
MPGSVSTPGLDDSARDFTLPYDKLVVAVGAINNTFGTDYSLKPTVVCMRMNGTSLLTLFRVMCVLMGVVASRHSRRGGELSLPQGD